MCDWTQECFFVCSEKILMQAFLHDSHLIRRFLYILDFSGPWCATSEIISSNCELGARLRERLPDHQFMTVKLSIIYIIKGILRRWDLHLSNYCPWDIYGPSLLGFFLPGEIFDFFYLIYSDHLLQFSFFFLSWLNLLLEGVIWLKFDKNF